MYFNFTYAIAVTASFFAIHGK